MEMHVQVEILANKSVPCRSASLAMIYLVYKTVDIYPFDFKQMATHDTLSFSETRGIV